MDVRGPDAYVEHLRVRPGEAGPDRVVVEQPADPEVDNHVRVRHASALYAAAYEAARRLVLAAVGERGDSVTVSLVDSEIAYTAVGLGVLTSAAEPRGEGWDSLAAALEAGEAVTLATSVASTDPDGKTVVTLDASFEVAPAG